MLSTYNVVDVFTILLLDLIVTVVSSVLSLYNGR